MSGWRIWLGISTASCSLLTQILRSAAMLTVRFWKVSTIYWILSLLRESLRNHSGGVVLDECGNSFFFDITFSSSKHVSLFCWFVVNLSADYPYCLAGKDLRSLIKNLLWKSGDALQEFFDHCLFAMLRELDKPTGKYPASWVNKT